MTDSLPSDQASIEHQLGEILLRYIDRLGDQTPEDNAEKIVSELLAEAEPVLDAHFNQRFSAIGGGYER